MSAGELFLSIFSVLGGLALFIFGMSVMSQGLRAAAGAGLRVLLTKATQNRVNGLGLGTLLGFLVHSSAASVMLVGFLNAGLLTLEQTVAPMLGTNLGTSLSMQLVSFRFTDYCFVMIAVGLLLQMVGPTARVKPVGSALIGFGLLFLGMKTMSGAIVPHRETLRALLVGIDGHTLSGRLMGAGLALLLTAIIQSSGATISMAFALADAGVFDSLWQTYPIIIGAQIGTCMTALLGSIGTHIEARRAAIGNMLTNVVNGIFSLFLAPLWIPLLAASSDALIRQTANTHTFLMIQNCVIFMPWIPFYAKLLRRIIAPGTPAPPASQLIPGLLPYPEQALAACIRELHRVGGICTESFRCVTRILLFAHRPRDVQLVESNEKAINAIKTAFRDYLAALSRRALSDRQALLLQYVDGCMNNLERIGDHLEFFCQLSLNRQKNPEALVSEEAFNRLFHLYESAFHIFRHVTESLNPTQMIPGSKAQHILDARQAYHEASVAARTYFTEQSAAHVITPIAGMYCNEFITTLDRIVRHARSIARLESQPGFLLRPERMAQSAGLLAGSARHPPVRADDYIARLKDY